MTLSERTGKLKTQIAELRRARSLAGQAEHFERRAEDLQAPATALAKVARSFHLLRDQGLQITLPDDLSLSQWDQKLKSIQAKYTEDPASVLNPTPGEDARYVLLKPLKELPDRVQMVLRQVWREWVEGQMPGINTEVLNILAGIGALRERAERLQTLLHEAQSSAEVLPSEAKDIVGFRNKVKAIQEAWDTLAGEGIPPAVIAFLRFAGSPSGASFDKLTPEVQDWLESHGLDGGLRIRLI